MLFNSKKKQATETEWEAEERRKTRCIFLTGRKGVTEYEAAIVIIDEAKTLIQEELGGQGYSGDPQQQMWGTRDQIWSLLFLQVPLQVILTKNLFL